METKQLTQAPTPEPHDADDIKVDPIWRQAAREAVDTFDYGQLIPHEWIRQHLEISTREGKMTLAQHRKLDFELLRKMDGFRDALLYEHKRYLTSVRSIGYKIIEPPDQTAAAMGRLSADLRRGVKKALDALIYIDETALSIEHHRENAEAKAKVAWLRTVGAKQISKGDKQ